MRFKTIFIIFNFVIVCSFLFIFFMPLILLGGEHFGEFFHKNWFIIVIFIATLAVFNVYFIRNWRLFQLLEKENWTALINYLENRIFQEYMLRRNYIKILINAYLVTSNTAAIMKLKNHIADKKPSLIKKFAVQFGIPYLLDNKPEESEKYFGKLLSERGVKEVDWIRWNYAFNLMQLKQFDGAKSEYENFIDNNKDPIIRLLSLYMLNSFPQIDLALRQKIEKRITEFKKAHSPKDWNSRIERSKGNIQILIFTKIIKDASDWIFQYSPSPEDRVLH
jgi:tetratricopeptide (TPR) repeat protein